LPIADCRFDLSAQVVVLTVGKDASSAELRQSEIGNCKSAMPLRK